MTWRVWSSTRMSSSWASRCAASALVLVSYSKSSMRSSKSSSVAFDSTSVLFFLSWCSFGLSLRDKSELVREARVWMLVLSCTGFWGFGLGWLTVGVPLGGG